MTKFLLIPSYQMLYVRCNTCDGAIVSVFVPLQMFSKVLKLVSVKGGTIDKRTIFF